jgi:uncharacterized protein (DUF1800 family)
MKVLRTQLARALFAAAALAGPLIQASAATDTPLGPEGARALLTRAAFAPSTTEIETYAALTHRQAVDRLLAGGTGRAARPAPAWVDERILPPRELRAMSDEQRRAQRREAVRRSLELRGWWLTEMTATSAPLTERMTLFWHNHFVSAQPKVRAPQLMYRQNVLLREHALGNFRTLLHAVAKDPAMLIYLDSVSNRKQSPNENFAREVMELFTLGEGRYTESDIKEAARAFTGWSIDPDTQRYTFRTAWHDDGEKTVLGARGRFDGDAVLDVLLTQPAAARFIVTKLWREFVAPTPDAARIETVAQAFRASNYDIKTAVRGVLLQPELIARTEANALIKSPVELAVGLVRQSAGQIASPESFALQVAGMGQNVFSPPNVRGWPGGEAWINTQTLLARKQFLETVLAGSASSGASMSPAMAASEKQSGVEKKADNAAPAVAAVNLELEQRLVRRATGVNMARVDAAAWLKSANLYPERAVGEGGRDRLERLLLAVPAVNEPRPDSLGLDALRALLLDPAYQIK